MILGSVAGLYSYFAVGFYVAALVGAAVSMTLVVTASFLKDGRFDFGDLQEVHPGESLPGSGG
jgi:hypothetical protein